MTKYLIAIHRPQNYDAASSEDNAMSSEINILNDEMHAAGIRLFVGGLQPPKSAKSLQTQPNGEMLISNGLYLDSQEYVGGFWVLELSDMDEALKWGRKAAIACRASIEVRPFH